MDFIRGFSACLIVVLTTMMLGCSQSSDIQLQGSKPVEQNVPNENGPGNSTGLPTAPKDPDASEPAPTSPPTAATRYRFLCDHLHPTYLFAVSSLASSSGFGADLVIGEPKANGKFDPLVDRNLVLHEHPLIVSLPKFGEARLIFSAHLMGRSIADRFSRFIFVSSVDIAQRGGVATRLAKELQVSSRAANAASAEHFSLRTFGASDGGRYLLIGTKLGYELRDAETLKSLGVIKTGSSIENFNPSLRESDMIFSVSSLKGASFETRLYSLGLTIEGHLKSSKFVTSTSGLRRPLVQVSNRAGDSFAAIETSNRIATVSPLKRPGNVTLVKIAVRPAKGRVSSATAFWRDAISGDLQAAIAFENVVLSSTGLTIRYKIEQVFVRALSVNETTLLASAIMPDFDYPPEARKSIESGGSGGRRIGVSDLKTSPDGKAIFGLFPAAVAHQIYRLSPNGLDRVSQTSCTNFSVGVEP